MKLLADRLNSQVRLTASGLNVPTDNPWKLHSRMTYVCRLSRNNAYSYMSLVLLRSLCANLLGLSLNETQQTRCSSCLLSV